MTSILYGRSWRPGKHVMRPSCCLLLIVIGLVYPAPVRAQAPADGGPDPAAVRVRLGPLAMIPTMGLSNLGVDKNVFNDPPGKQPREDFTATLTPKTDLWLHVGGTWVTAAINEQIIWYQKYASERSASNAYSVGWKLPLTWLIVNTNVAYAKVRDRPGFEVDARVSRKDLAYGGSVEGRIMSKTFFGVRGERRKVDFDQAALFLDVNLHDELNHVTTSSGLLLRHQITSLTSISVNATRSEDRFEFSPLRDSVSTMLGTTVTFDPFALIHGSATFGFRDFEPRSSRLPSFKGSTMAIDLSFSIYETTRFGVHAVRDIEYSYDVNQPYYLLTGFDASIAQQIFGPFDTVLRVGEQRLAYRDRIGATINASNRTDAVHSKGLGVGYHLGKELRLGFNLDTIHRTSVVVSRPYEGLKFGTALTYGF